MTKQHLDHVTQRVIGSAFQTICEEMGHTMIRTANSSLFVEGRDFSCAIVDRNAELIAAANYDPSHLSAMALTVEFVVLFFGPDNIFPGDVYLVNDPYRGGGHLPDITLIRPVFEGPRLLGYAVNRAHHLDIGGMAVAGFPGTARSVFQEGLRIPPVRWFQKGEENRDIIEFITLNVRFPRDQWGDFQAQLASTQTAERRLLRLAGRYGAEAIQAAMEDVKDHSEELTRLMIRDLPGGRYSFTEFVDDDGVTDQPRRIVVTVTIDGDRMKVDFTGSSPQAEGPVNSSYGNTLSSTFNAILQLLGPDVQFNNGCFRPIEVIVPRGCLLNPAPPAPCFGGVTEVSIRVVDAVMGALAPVASQRIGAGSYGTCINFSGGGYDAERKASYGFYFFIEGGWGACSWRDGWNCTPNPTSNFNDYPVEWIESTLPLRYKEVRLHTDSGGPGLWRGGVGTIRTVQLLADSVEINSLGERFLIAPFGLEGGDPGACNALFIKNGRDGSWQTIRQALHTASPSKFSGLRSGRDSWFRMVSGGGGGYGEAIARPPSRVVDDVVQGFVSREGAEADYGVVISMNSDYLMGYDAESTAELRALMRNQPRRRHLERTSAIESATATTNGQELSEEARQTIEATEERIAMVAERLRSELGVDRANQLGSELKTPFTNARAVKFWDLDSFDRWLQRHGKRNTLARSE